MAAGRIHSTESFGSVDGPGIRFLIFTQGCAMRCRYCHNADTWNKSGGKEMTADELIKTALRYRPYWGSEGGITVSGGEPLLQLDFLIELFTKAREHGINTCVDTAGQPFSRNEPFFGKFKKLCELCDLFLVDIKHIEPEGHKSLTGVGNENILDMLRFLSDINKPVWIRHVLVPGITDDDELLKKTADFIGTLSNVKKTEVLPYHSMGAYKWEKLGVPYTLADASPPTAERLENARRILGQKTN